MGASQPYKDTSVLHSIILSVAPNLPWLVLFFFFFKKPFLLVTLSYQFFVTPCILDFRLFSLMNVSVAASVASCLLKMGKTNESRFLVTVSSLLCVYNVFFNQRLNKRLL